MAGFPSLPNPFADKIVPPFVADTNTHYVLSAHGGCSRALGPRFNPPPTIQIVFYSQAGKIFAPDAAVQTKICNDQKQLDLYEQSIEELAILPGQYPTYPKKVGIPKSHSSLNYELTPDTNVPKKFYSGLVCCRCKVILYNIDKQPVIDLESLCKLVKLHNDNTHAGKFAHIHYLACRSTESGDSGVAYLSKSGLKEVEESPHPPLYYGDMTSLFKDIIELERKEGKVVTMSDPIIQQQFQEYKITLTPEYQLAYSHLSSTYPPISPQSIHKGSLAYYTAIKAGYTQQQSSERAIAVSKQGGKVKTKRTNKKFRLRSKNKKLIRSRK